MSRKKICIVVLGDIGRSPRMQYHANSLAEEGHIVDIVGFKGASPIDSLQTQPLVSFHYLNPFPNIPLPRILKYILKTIWQMINLFFVLCIIRAPDIILTQNPPAVPTLFVTYFYKKITGCKLIIDWHNYAYTIMALNLSNNNPLVKITKFIECFIGARADHNFCVTNSMKDNLKNNWEIEAITLYDRPPDMFKPISTDEKHKLFVKLGTKYEVLSSDTDSIFTQLKDDKVILKQKRPGLIVSSTSWTEDEDFSELLSALIDYENVKKSENKKLPNLICIITGKGPLKDFYCKKIDELKLEHVTILTPWLETEDYPLLLASADLGVSLHTSSSGLDLPMKVVDMFGCGLPVCAYNFQSLHELVQHEKNGYVFNNAQELFLQIQNWFENFPSNKEQINKSKSFQEELKLFQNLRWHENWKNNVSMFFK